MALKAGDIAPEFSTLSTSGKPVKLSDFKGKWVALYFYPKAFTPGCTQESCNLRDNYQRIQQKNVIILGVSLDNITTQQKFKEKYKLPFELLDDSNKKISRAYDCLGFLSLYSKRKTFLINPEGKIAVIIDKVSTGNHDEQILNALK